MGYYPPKTPLLVKKIFPSLVWNLPPKAHKTLYLTFDDGPTSDVTPAILEILKSHAAHATFFCVGKNLEQHPNLVAQIQADGHRIGNHTYDHSDGWKKPTDQYINQVLAFDHIYPTTLFRPPYGHMKRAQRLALQGRFRIIMWDVLSGDFDPKLNCEKCLKNVTKNARDGSIVVFHDNEKAKDKVLEVLSKTLVHFSKLGYRFSAITD